MPRFKVRGSFWLLMTMWLLLIPIRWVSGLLLAAAIHETGHLIALKLCGIPVRSIELSAGEARLVTGAMEPKQELLCALAGPVAGCSALLLWNIFPEAALAALVQTAFNLLPVYPLDGGRAWRAARNICCKSGDFRVQ